MMRILGKARTYLTRDMKIYQKLILAVALLIVIPLIILSLMFTGRLNGIVQNEIISTYSNTVGQYMENVNYKLNTYRNILASIAMNRTVLGIFSNQYVYGKGDQFIVGKEVADQVSSLSFNNDRGSVNKITLYAISDDFPSDGNNISNISQIRDEAWFKDADLLKQSGIFFGKTYNGTSIISMTRPIVQNASMNFLDSLGFVKMDIQMSNVFGTGSGKPEKSFTSAYFTDETNRVIYSVNANGATLSDESLRLAANRQSGQFVSDIGGQKQIVVYQAIQQYGMRGIFLYPYDEINKKVRQEGLYVEITLAALLLVFSGLTILFSRAFSNRISLLVRKMDGTAKGDLAPRPRIEGKDEIGILDDRFNMMVERIKSLIEENYLRRLEKKEAELDALQFQINPHFLYNTLQAIDTLAQKVGAQEISDISLRLGEMFRYNMSHGGSEFVPLAEEINHIRNYLYIQNMRYGDKFSVFIDMPDEFGNQKILRFILQPLVENCIVHAFRDKRGQGCLEIRCRMEEGLLFIILQDDGAGMDEERLRELTDYINDLDVSIPKAFPKSVGIKNVNARLKLTYGAEYGLLIESKPDLGTTVTVKLPAGREGEETHV